MDCTREELLKMLVRIHNEHERKVTRLNEVRASLGRARLQVKSQREILSRMRQRIVELTPSRKGGLVE